MTAQCEECIEREDACRQRAADRPVKVSTSALARFASFVEAEKRLPLASRQVDRPERTLGSWLSTQRTHYRRGVLEQASVEALDRVYPGWQETDPMAVRFDGLWMRTFERVAQHLSDHGELPSRSDGHLDLFEWLHQQQSVYDSGDMLPHRRELIDLLGDWRNARTHRYGLARWRATLAEVVAFRERTGSLPSTRAATGTDERRLAFWLRRQRGLLRSGELLDIQVTELTATPGWEGRPSGGAGSHARTQDKTRGDQA